MHVLELRQAYWSKLPYLINSIGLFFLHGFPEHAGNTCLGLSRACRAPLRALAKKPTLLQWAQSPWLALDAEGSVTVQHLPTDCPYNPY